MPESEAAVSLAICGAKLADGLCQSSPEPGKRRCFSHGGAPRSGAPKGNANALKHGYCSGALWRSGLGIRRRLKDLTPYERNRLRWLRQQARARIAGGESPLSHIAQDIKKRWDGQILYRALRKTLKVYEEQILNERVYAGDWARVLGEFDMLRSICGDASSFDSMDSLADEVLRLVVAVTRRQCSVEYRVAWWNMCSSIFSYLFGDAES